MNTGVEDPWNTMAKTVDSKATPVNRFRLANVMYGEGMKEALKKKGAIYKKNGIIQVDDMPFFEAATKEYNKSLNEYDTLHFADDVVVNDKDLPDKYTPLSDWRDLKNVYEEVTESLDKARQDSKIFGRNDSDDEESTHSTTVELPEETKKYLIYWNLFANQNPKSFRKMNQELPDNVYFESGRSKRMTTAASGKKKKTKKDNGNDQIIATIERVNDVEYDQLQLERSRSRFIERDFQFDSFINLHKHKLYTSDHKEKNKKEVIAVMNGDSNRERRKEY
jgi:hypothetical protein